MRTSFLSSVGQPEDGCDDDPSPRAFLENLRLGRVPESYVVFMKAAAKAEGLEVLGYSKIEEIEFFVSEHLDDLKTDSFYSINGFWSRGTRRSEDLSCLNACFSDLDHREIDNETAVAEVMEIVRSGEIPAPSFIGFSGRGTWLFWTLRCPETGEPPKANREAKQLWNDVQRAINARLSSLVPELKPDLNAIDASRLTRVPGSVNSKSGKTVRYLYQADPTMGRHSYSLSELADHFEVVPESVEKVGREIPKTKIPNNATGLQVMQGERLSEFDKLEESRNGFAEGCRNKAVYILVLLLLSLGVAPSELEARVFGLASRCRPEYSQAEVVNTIDSVLRNKSRPRIKNTTIASWLGVTLEEADQIGLIKLRPDFREVDRSKGRADQIAARRADLKIILSKYESRPSLRDLALLLGDWGHEAGKDTVRNDLQMICRETGDVGADCRDDIGLEEGAFPAHISDTRTEQQGGSPLCV